MSADTNPSDDLPYRKGVLSIIYRENKVLLIRKPGRDKDEWYFPAGGKESNESYENTFFREMKEELNIDPEDVVIEVTDLDHKYKWGRKYREKTGCKGQKQKVVFAKLKEGAQVKINDTDELEDYKFEKINNLESILPFQNLLDLLDDLRNKEDIPEAFDDL